MSALFDAGLQPERTELAWRRSALSLGIGSLVALRLLPDSLGSPWWTIVGVAGLMIAAALWFHARSRYRAITAALTHRDPASQLPDGRALGAFTALALALGLLAAAVVVSVASA